MKVRMLIVVAVGLLLFGGVAIGVEFEEPVRIEAGGAAIDTDIGHAAPFVCDFDGDGVQDLLVGQFGEGLLWIYRNEGTNAAPKLAAGVKFMAGTEDGRVPSG